MFVFLISAINCGPVSATQRTKVDPMNIVVSFLAVFFLSSCAVLGSPRLGDLQPSASLMERQVYLTKQIDKILEKKLSPSAPGVAVVIRKDQQIIYSAARGMADLNQNKPIALNTVFDVASVSKPITAVATMQLQKQGRIRLSDSVRRWLPDLSPRWQAITIHHLLAHQSGIPDCCSGVSLETFQKLDGMSNAQLLSRFYQDDTLIFEPGSRAEYNNSNYILLAEVIARVTNEAYPDYIKNKVFVPLGMSASYVGVTPPGFIFDQALNHAKDRRIFGIFFELVGQSGTYSSVLDLLTFMDGIYSDQLISRNELKQMTADQSAAPVSERKDLHYGYGWYVPAHSSGLSFFSHNGGTDGFASVLSVDFEKGIDVVVLGNGGEHSGEVINLIIDAVRKAFAKYSGIYTPM